jgi:hypothetical protein
MKLNKTETNLIKRSHQRSNGAILVFAEHGLSRGRGGTGKLRNWGKRERNAIKSLKEKGLVGEITHEQSTNMKNGYSTLHYNSYALLKEKGKEIREKLMKKTVKCIGNCGKDIETKNEKDKLICEECRSAWVRINN